MDMKTFMQVEVLTNGKEAELLMIHAVCVHLGFSIEVIMLDRTPGAAQRYTLPDEDFGGPPQATLLFRPGHYDIYYRRSLYKEVTRMEDMLNLRESCGKGCAGVSGGGGFGGSGGLGGGEDRYTPSASGPAGQSHSRNSASSSASRRGNGDSLEDAMHAFRQALRDSVRDCVVAIDREAREASKETRKLEADRAACKQLEEEIRCLTQQLAQKQEALREEQDAVSRLQATTGGARGFLACCYCPSSSVDATHEVSIPPPHADDKWG